MIRLLLLLPFLSFGQIDFFKYSTIYTSMNVNTSMIEQEDYRSMLPILSIYLIIHLYVVVGIYIMSRIFGLDTWELDA